MVTIGFTNQKKERQFKDLEQGACFIIAMPSAEGTNLFMKTQIIGETDAYAESALNCVLLATGRATYCDRESYVLEHHVDINAREVD